MSVVVELQKLVDWIADLRQPQAPAPAETPLPKHGWTRIEERMEAAASKFGELADSIDASPVSTVHRRSPQVQIDAADEWNLIMQLSRDLRRESQNLALRARVLALRGEPTSRSKQVSHPDEDGSAPTTWDEWPEEVEAGPAPETADDGVDDEERTRAGVPLDVDADVLEAQHDRLEVDPGETGADVRRPPSTPEEIVKVAKGAQRPVATAMKRILELSNPDWVASSFLDELDALAESALQVVQRCEHARGLAAGKATP